MDSDELPPELLPAKSGNTTKALMVVAMLIVAGAIAYSTFYFYSNTKHLDYSNEWVYDMIQADELHSLKLTGANVTIGIIDSGIDTDIDEFSDINITHWKDFVNLRGEPYDDEGHGTAMASIIVADGKFEGIATGVSLIIAKAINSEGEGLDEDIVNAIHFCMDPNGDGNSSDAADIISMSLGGRTRRVMGNSVASAAADATGIGIIVVAAAGNDGGDANDVSSPSSAPSVISVGSVDSDGAVADFSSVSFNYSDTPTLFDRQDPNMKPEVVAPGVDITVVFPKSLYRFVEGTSVSTAIVSGLLALVLEARPDLTLVDDITPVNQVKVSLQNTCLPVSGQDLPHDLQSGYGIIQGYSMLEYINANY